MWYLVAWPVAFVMWLVSMVFACTGFVGAVVFHVCKFFIDTITKINHSILNWAGRSNSGAGVDTSQRRSNSGVCQDASESDGPTAFSENVNDLVSDLQGLIRRGR